MLGLFSMVGEGGFSGPPHHLPYRPLEVNKMKLYVANCSKQEFLFTYMLPENIRPFSHHIRAGSQVEIIGNQDDIDSIIGQHTIYGLVEANKVKKGFGGLCYRMEKPVSIDAIEQGLEQTAQDQIDKALEARKMTAAAADMVISQKAQEMGLKQKAPLEVEVIEESKNPFETSNKFNETIEVVKENMAPKRGRPRK